MDSQWHSSLSIVWFQNISILLALLGQGQGLWKQVALPLRGHDPFDQHKESQISGQNQKIT